MYIPWKSKHFGVCFAKSFVFYAIRRGAEADFVNIHKCAPFNSSFLYRSMHPGLAVKGGFAHSSATNGFLDDYFFSSCSFTVFSNCSGGSIGGLPNFTPLALLRRSLLPDAAGYSSVRFLQRKTEPVKQYRLRRSPSGLSPGGYPKAAYPAPQC